MSNGATNAIAENQNASRKSPRSRAMRNAGGISTFRLICYHRLEYSENRLVKMHLRL